MAALFAVGLPFTYDGTTNHFATTTGGSATVAAVTSADDVTVDSLSGNATLTIGAAWSCNTLTINNGSATVACDGTHGITSSGTVTLTAGTLNTNGQTCSWGSFITSAGSGTGLSLTLGTSVINISAASSTALNITTTTAITLSAASSTINLTGASGGIRATNAASYTFGTVTLTGGTTMQVNAAVTYTNLTITGTNQTTSNVSLVGNPTVTGTLTLGGNTVQGANRLQVFSSVIGTQRTIAATGAAVVINGDVDFQDITISGSPSWTNAGASWVGDCGGNGTLITNNITVSAPQVWQGTTGGSWSTAAKWTSRSPLPQDDVTYGNAFSASQTVTVDMPRIGRSVDFSGCTGSPVWTWQSAIRTNYGSFTGPSNGTFTSFSGIVMSGRGSYTIDQKGLGLGTTISAPSGTYTATSTFSTGSGGFGITAGTFDANNFNVSVGAAFTCTGAITRAFKMGSGIWTMSGTGSVFSVAAGGLTMTAGTSTLIISNTSVTTKTISCSGGGQTFYNLQINGAASAAAVTIAGANTFNNITGQANAHLTLPSSITTTTSSLTSQGTAGNLFVLDASVAGTAATLYSPSYLRTEYLSVKDNTAAGATPFSAGDNGTLVSGTTNWITVSHATLFNDYQFVHAGDGMSVTEGIR